MGTIKKRKNRVAELRRARQEAFDALLKVRLEGRSEAAVADAAPAGAAAARRAAGRPSGDRRDRVAPRAVVASLRPADALSNWPVQSAERPLGESALLSRSIGRTWVNHFLEQLLLSLMSRANGKPRRRLP
jgi:hypothetical protein